MKEHNTMKNILFALAITISVIATAATPSVKFIGWNRTAAEYKAQLADGNAIASYRAYCAYKIAAIEAPETVKDIASIEAIIRNSLKSLNAKRQDDDTVRNLVISCISGDTRKDLIPALLSDPAYASHDQTIVTIKAYRAKALGIVQTDAERKAVLADAMQPALARKNVYLATRFLTEYIELTTGDKDEDVLPVLRKLYRYALPKLEDESYKPFIVKLSLALKSRGENVQ